uniref:Uncharacterized protein n=1 Tax=viral metagenome TaxID=1070528 RepID=A0A6C0DN80_9ZZZZ
MFKQVLSKIIKAGRTSISTPLLYSRAVLYFLVFFTLSEVAYFVNQNDTSSVMTLVLIGLLTSFFNKNMVIILFTALVFTNLLRLAMPKQDYILSEGFEDKVETAPIKASSEKTSSEKTSSHKKEDKEQADATLSLKEDFDEFQTVQKKILESMNDLNPLLDKAEAFIQKYEQYKNVKDK